MTVQTALPFEVILDTAQVSPKEWLEQRRKGLGGTDAAALLGHNPWKSVTSLWYDKLREDEEVVEQSTSEAAYWGLRLESIVSDEFRLRHPNLVVWPAGLHLRSTIYPWARGTLDSWIAEVKPGVLDLKPTSFLECKTTAWYRGKDWRNGLIPPYVRCQVLHYFLLTGFEYCYTACLVGGQAFFAIRYERDERLIKQLLELEEKFWGYVERREEPPDPFGSTAILNPEGFEQGEVMQVVQLDSHHLELIREYHEALKVNSESYDRVKQIREELEGHLYGGRQGIYQGEVVLEWLGARAKRRLVIPAPR